MSRTPRARPSHSRPASRTPSATRSSRSTPLPTRAFRSSGSVVDLTLDDDDDIDHDSEASFHTARGADHPLDLRSVSPELIDPHPRKTAREAQLAERDRLGKRPARAKTISDSEAEDEEDRQKQLDRARDQAIRRKYDPGSSSSKRSSREDDSDHDIIVESSPFLDFSMPALVGMGINGPTGRAISVGPGVPSSDMDVDLDTESGGGEAFRRAIEAEFEANEGSYLGLDLATIRTTPKAFSLRAASPQIHNVGEPSRLGKTASDRPVQSQILVNAPIKGQSTSQSGLSIGTDRSAFGFPMSGNQAVDETQEDFNQTHNMSAPKRIPQTPPYPPPLSEPDLDSESELHGISGLDKTCPSVPFPQTPPGPPPDFLPRMSNNVTTFDRVGSARRDNTCAVSPALTKQSNTDASDHRPAKRQDMTRPYLIKTPESYKPILRKWDPIRDGLAGSTSASPERITMLPVITTRTDDRLEVTARLDASRPGVSRASSSRSLTLDSPSLSVDDPSTASSSSTAPRASTRSARAGVRLEAKRSRLRGESDDIREYKKNSARADDNEPMSDSPTLLSRISGLSTDHMEEHDRYSADKARTALRKDAGLVSSASDPPGLLSRIAKTVSSADPLDSSSRSHTTRARTPPLLPPVSSVAKETSRQLTAASSSTQSSQSHQQIVATKPTPSRATFALGRAISNSRTGVQVMRFLRMEMEHLRGDCMKDYEIVFSPDYDCPTRAFLETLVMHLGGTIIPYDSPRAKDQPVRPEITRVFVCGDAAIDEARNIVAAKAYESAQLMDLITRLREAEVGHKLRQSSQLSTKSQLSATRLPVVSPDPTLSKLPSSSRSFSPLEPSRTPVTRQSVSIVKGLHHRIGHSAAAQAVLVAEPDEALTTRKASGSTVRSNRQAHSSSANASFTTASITSEGTFYGKDLITRMKRTNDTAKSESHVNTRSHTRSVTTSTPPGTRLSDQDKVPVSPPRARTLRERMRA